MHRFSELRADLGIGRNVLQARLERLVEHGILERRRYHEHPPRDHYHLTEAGLDRPDGPPVTITHRPTGTPAAGRGTAGTRAQR